MPADSHNSALADDLTRELARLVRLRALGGPRGVLAKRVPALVVRPASRERRLYGKASYRRNRVTIVMYWSTTRADARATLLHELVHLAGHVRHDASFKHALVEAAREGFDVDVGGYERGPYRDLDRALERALWWRELRTWAASMWSSLFRPVQVGPTSARALSSEVW